MTRIFFVRHGQTGWNASFRYQGQTDIELNEFGLAQAELVAHRLKREQIKLIVTSDLCRAKVTAEKVAEVCGVPLRIEPAFREINFGLWEGQTYDAVRKRWPDLLEKLYTSPDEIVIPGGESFNQVQVRAMAAVRQLIKEFHNESIVVLSHGATIRTIICNALNLGLNQVWNLRQDNTAVNLIEYVPERTILSLLNDTHHLFEPIKSEEELPCQRD